MAGPSALRLPPELFHLTQFSSLWSLWDPTYSKTGSVFPRICSGPDHICATVSGVQDTIPQNATSGTHQSIPSKICTYDVLSMLRGYFKKSQIWELWHLLVYIRNYIFFKNFSFINVSPYLTRKMIKSMEILTHREGALEVGVTLPSSHFYSGHQTTCRFFSSLSHCCFTTRQKPRPYIPPCRPGWHTNLHHLPAARRLLLYATYN